MKKPENLKIFQLLKISQNPETVSLVNGIYAKPMMSKNFTS